MRRVLMPLLAALVLAACGSQASPVVTPAPTPELPAFDVEAVRSNFADECRDPGVVDDLFCEQVKITEMSGTGSVLNVPTTLNAVADDRASAICDMLALAHFDADGEDLGYEFIGVLDQDGGNAAACSVS